MQMGRACALRSRRPKPRACREAASSLRGAHESRRRRLPSLAPIRRHSGVRASPSTVVASASRRQARGARQTAMRGRGTAQRVFAFVTARGQRTRQSTIRSRHIIRAPTISPTTVGTTAPTIRPTITPPITAPGPARPSRRRASRHRRTRASGARPGAATASAQR